jgi:hypothetical protein
MYGYIDPDRIGRDLGRDPLAVSLFLFLLLQSSGERMIPDSAIVMAQRSPAWPCVKAQLQRRGGGFGFHSRHVSDREPRRFSTPEFKDDDDVLFWFIAQALPRKGR